VCVWLLQVAIIIDIDGLMAKVIHLRDVFPSSDILHILSLQPRLLLHSPARMQVDAAEVKTILNTVEGGETLLDSIPVGQDFIS
jgi:hypothetical protein